ncbi:hypothetical protein BKA62DRAFT_739653, partial [Auriculariales sp. MPI-PUGE-AT-0066]
MSKGICRRLLCNCSHFAILPLVGAQLSDAARPVLNMPCGTAYASCGAPRGRHLSSRARTLWYPQHHQLLKIEAGGSRIL